MTLSMNPQKKCRNILITGASSGIGYQSALCLLKEGHRLILPCRTNERSNDLIKSLKKDLKCDHSLDRVYAPILELSDLFSIKKFAKKLMALNQQLDIIILNAGLQYTGAKSPKWSAQDIELTFAVNHVANQYLIQLLLPLIEKVNLSRIIITSSEVHNPKTSGGSIGEPAGLGDLVGLNSSKRFSLLNGDSEFNADKAYKDSKLCNILFARKLSKILNISGSDIAVIAWAPGLVIPRSREGFFRYSRKYNEFGQRLFSFFARDLFRITETPENAGKLLVSLALDERYNKSGFNYYSNKLVTPFKKVFALSKSSIESLDDQLSSSLWQLTSKLITEKIRE